MFGDGEVPVPVTRIAYDRRVMVKESLEKTWCEDLSQRSFMASHLLSFTYCSLLESTSTGMYVYEARSFFHVSHRTDPNYFSYVRYIEVPVLYMRYAYIAHARLLYNKRRAVHFTYDVATYVPRCRCRCPHPQQRCCCPSSSFIFPFPPHGHYPRDQHFSQAAPSANTVNLDPGHS